MTILFQPLILCGCRGVNIKQTSQILYLHVVPSQNSTWIYDVDSDEKHLITDDPFLSPRGWSPSGEYILFDGIGLNRQGEIWLSNSDGSNLKKMFDSDDYPEVANYFGYNQLDQKTHISYWLNDQEIMVTTESDRKFIFNRNTHKISDIRNNNDVYLLSPTGDFWIEYQDQIGYVTIRGGSEIPIPDHLSEISPDGKLNAYIKTNADPNGADDIPKTILLADITRKAEISNERIIAQDNGSIYSLHWSPDSRLIFYHKFDGNPNQESCVVIRITDQQKIYDKSCEIKDVLLWSPRSDGFITQPNLKEYTFYHLSGEVETIMEHDSTYPGSDMVIDWRLIPAP